MHRLTPEEYTDIKSWLPTDEQAIEWYLQLKDFES
jgi:hypothetical protein